MSRFRADAILLLAAGIWGVAFLFQKSAMDHIGPVAFVAARGLVAALALLPFALHEGWARSAPEPGLWRAGILGGVLFFIAAWLQQDGIITATVTNAGFLTALYVVITPFIVWTWHAKKPGGVLWLAVLLSIAGMWLLSGGVTGALSQGDVLIAVSAFFWAANVVVTGHAARYARPLTFTAIQFVVVSVLGVVAAGLLETPSWEGLAAASLDIAYVGIVSGALCFALLSIALRYTPPSEAAIIVSTETVFAAVGGYLLFGERLPLINWFGAGLILVAICLVQGAPLLASRRR